MLLLSNYLVIIGAVGGLLDARVFFAVANLNANNGIHVETSQLTRFNDRDAYLGVITRLWSECIKFFMVSYEMG